MKDQTRTVLVVGATGQQGGAVARHLVARGFHVRAMTRTSGSESAKALTALGMSVVEGDLNETQSLRDAIGDAQGVFSVQNFYEKGVGLEGEVRQGRALVDAARAANIGHFVQSTMADTPDVGDVEHFRSKFEIEHYVRASGLPFTMVGTVWFMDNMRNPKMGGPMTFPGLAGTLKPSTSFHMLAVDDLGAAVAQIFSDPQAHLGLKRDLASEVMTVAQMKTTYRQVTGETPKAWRMPNVLLRLFAPDFAAQLRWHNRVNWSFSPEVLEALAPNKTTLADFIARHQIRGL
jgi:uncharacterized protein YbjT (DUF2867 family)